MTSDRGSWKRLTGVAAGVLLAAMTVAPGAPRAQTNDKWVTVVLPAEPAHLEGCYSSASAQGRVVKQNIVETLVEKDPGDNTLKGRLATSWEQLDATTWRIKLRDGVTFHDGSPFNAAAVKSSIERSRSKALVCRDYVKFFGDIAIEATPLDDLTLQIKTSRPDPILPLRLAGITIVGPNTPLDKPSLSPVGTGPYVFDGWQAGQQIVLKRNDRYWGAKPAVEGARYVWRDGSSVRASMVKVGEADIGHSISPEDATETSLDFSFLNSETVSWRIDMALAPLDDKRVRQALNYAIDRQSFIGSILPKSVLPATQVVMPSIPGHNHELDKKSYGYEPEKARRLLAEAKADGVPVDKEILLVANPAYFPNVPEFVEASSAMYRAAGFNTKVLIVEGGQSGKWNYKPFPEGRPPSLFLSSHDNNSGDPVFSVTLKYGCDGGTSTYCDAGFDKTVLEASNLGGPERVAAWNRIFRTLYEDVVPDVMLYHMVSFIRVSPRIAFVPDVTTNTEIHLQKIRFKS